MSKPSSRSKVTTNSIDSFLYHIPYRNDRSLVVVYGTSLCPVSELFEGGERIGRNYAGEISITTNSFTKAIKSRFNKIPGVRIKEVHRVQLNNLTKKVWLLNGNEWGGEEIKVTTI